MTSEIIYTHTSFCMNKKRKNSDTEHRNATLDFLNKTNKNLNPVEYTPITTQQNVLPKLSEALQSDYSSNINTETKRSITCERCMTTIEYFGEDVFVVCYKCQKKLNPFKLLKFACFYCGKKSYIKEDWDKFQCSTCSKIVFRIDLNPNRKVQLVQKYLESECPKIRKRSDNGFKIPANPYMLFSKLKRQEIKKQQPELNFSEIGAVLGKMWNNLTKEEKSVYKVLYEENKKECDSYNSNIEYGGNSNT